MSKNLLYPGRPNYEGPVQGFFGLLHHSLLAEWSHDVMERVEYVKRWKFENEVEIRLWNMCYLSEERLPKEFVEAWRTWEEVKNTHRKAGKTYEEAGKTYWEAWKTYDEAVKTYLEAEKAYLKAEKACREARYTYYKILQSSSPLLLALIKELVPDTAWNGQELVFPN